MSKARPDNAKYSVGLVAALFFIYLGFLCWAILWKFGMPYIPHVGGGAAGRARPTCNNTTYAMFMSKCQGIRL
jgi:hypothetical protein